MSDLLIFGECYSCNSDKYPLTLFQGHWYCPPDLAIARDSVKSKYEPMERRVDEFNRLIKRASGGTTARG